MVTISMNGLISSEETQQLIRSRHPGYTEHTFRNHINLKHLRPAKRIKQGQRSVLFFDEPGIEEYLRYLANRKIKTGRVKSLKSPDITQYQFEVYRTKLDVLLEVFTKDELDQKLKTVLDEAYSKIKVKLDEIESQKKSLLREMKSSINL